MKQNILAAFTMILIIAMIILVGTAIASQVFLGSF
jgi:hypothetical protein